MLFYREEGNGVLGIANVLDKILLDRFFNGTITSGFIFYLAIHSNTLTQDYDRIRTK